MITRRFQLDISLPGSQIAIYTRKGDTRVYAAIIGLCERSIPIQLEQSWTAALRARKPDGALLYDVATIQGGQIRVYFDTQAFTAAGVMACELDIYGENGEALFSPRFDVYIEDVVVSDETIESTNEFTALTEVMNKVKGYEEDLTAAIAQSEAATRKADEAGSDAQEAANVMNDMTVSATLLPPSEEPTVSITDVEGHKHVEFGITQGMKGEDGVATALAPGLFGMYVRADGHLMLAHCIDTPAPPLSVVNGRLIYQIQ